MLDQLITAADEPRHEVSCPACGATIRARMADAEGGESGAPGPAIEPHADDGSAGEALWDAIHDDEGYRAAVNAIDLPYGVDSSDINQIATEAVRIVIAQGWRPPSAGSDTTTETEG